jgi:GntR family transcriptional regulator / MocR family aminotransferase
MELHVRLDRGAPLSVQIYRQVLEAMRDGTLRHGDRLPPTRELASRLGVSRNTVTVAYDLLMADGVLSGLVGSGTFVRTGTLTPSSRKAPAGAVSPKPEWRAIDVSQQLDSRRVAFDFGVGTPDVTLFPARLWSRLLSRVARSTVADGWAYSDPRGSPSLRHEIARHLALSRGLAAGAGDVMVTQGAQQAFDLIGRVLIAPGTCVAVEEPGYPPLRALFKTLGAKVVGVAVDREGIRVAAIPPAARIVYVTPSHQFPLGMPMSHQRRMALLAWASLRDAVVIEDDYDTEFRFGGRPLDPLQRLDREGRVIYVGSFSKVLAPSLRLGFLIAPGSLQPALHAARRLSAWHGVTWLENTLARFIHDGCLAAHIRSVARVYAERHAEMSKQIEKHCGRWLTALPSEAGLHLATELNRGVSVNLAALRQDAADRGLRLSTIADFSAEPRPKQGLVLGFGKIAAPQIAAGIQQLATLVARHAGPHGHGRLDHHRQPSHPRHR